MTSRRGVLALVLVALGAGLFLTRVDGVFTIDEDSYLATLVSLRAGRLTIPGTEGLPPSSELYAFDAAPRSRAITTTPVSSSSPPLYAPLALPFAWFGWPGLVAMQILAFLACTWLIFLAAEQNARRARTPWLAAAAFVLGGFTLEYAQGTWPQMTSACLTFASFYAALRLQAGGRTWLGALAGFLGGLAVGVRYLTLAHVGMIGLGLFCWSPGRRVRTTASFAAGLALPLLLCSAMNASRLGSWNPVSKGAFYLDLGAEHARTSVVVDAAVSTWARIVDFSAWPIPVDSLHEMSSWQRKHEETGAILIGGEMKKSLLQSAPWVLLALGGMVLAWRRRTGATAAGRELRMASLLTGAVIGLFALYGFRRTDGYGYNQRYLLELMPVLALAFARVLDDVEIELRALVLGTALAGSIVFATLQLDLLFATRLRALSFIPLALAFGSALTVLAQPGRARAASLLCGACLGWALVIHLMTDLPASRLRRREQESAAQTMAATIPPGQRSAIFVYWGNKDSLGPLLLDRDVVVADPWIDRGASALSLAAAFLSQGRTVYVLGGLPPGLPRDALAGFVVASKRGLPQLVRITLPRP